MLLLLLLGVFTSLVNGVPTPPADADGSSYPPGGLSLDDMIGPAQQGSRIVPVEVERWPNRRIPYILDSPMDDSQKAVVMSAIRHINDKTCVKFVPWQPGDTAFANITNKAPPHSCTADVGYGVGVRQVNLGPGYCYQKGVVLHELFHAIGFHHEMNRPDRDEHIDIHYHNIVPDPAIRYWLFMKFGKDQVDTLDEPYDLNSIMQYGSFTGAISESRPAMEAKSGPKYIRAPHEKTFLSETDIRRVRKLYGC